MLGSNVRQGWLYIQLLEVLYPGLPFWLHLDMWKTAVSKFWFAMSKFWSLPPRILVCQSVLTTFCFHHVNCSVYKLWFVSRSDCGNIRLLIPSLIPSTEATAAEWQEATLLRHRVQLSLLLPPKASSINGWEESERESEREHSISSEATSRGTMLLPKIVFIWEVGGGEVTDDWLGLAWLGLLWALLPTGPVPLMACSKPTTNGLPALCEAKAVRGCSR